MLTLEVDLTRWSTNKIGLIIFFAAKDGEALYSQQKTRPGADCGSDHELLIAKFRLKLKTVGKTNRLFKYFPKVGSLGLLQWHDDHQDPRCLTLAS